MPLQAETIGPPRASSHRLPARVRVAVLADMLEERWPSMDLVADSLVREFTAQPELGIDPLLVRPRLLRVTEPWRRAADAIPTKERVLNRFWLYRRSLPRAAQADLFHVVDHSYAHLVTHLAPAQSIVTCHDIDAFADCGQASGRASGLPAFLVRRLIGGLQQAAMIVCPSESTAEALVGSGLTSRSRVAVVHNGVDIAPVPALRATEVTRDILGAAGHSIDLLHVGSAIPRKRLDILLEVFARVGRVVPAARLIRVGGPLTAEQETMATRLNVRHRIVVLPSVDRETLAAVYSRAALLLTTSEREGFGLPIVEAFAAGTPVIASDLPVFREVAGEAATYVPLEDIDGWAEQIVSHLIERGEQPDAWRRRQLNAMRRGALFSWSRHAREVAAVYRRVLGDCGKEP